MDPLDAARPTAGGDVAAVTAARERLATGAWLTRPLMTFAALVMIGGTILALAALVLTAHGTVDQFGRPVGTDFSSFWTAGRMALEGHAPHAYEWAKHWEVQRRTHGVDDFFPWSYPPVFLLVAAAVATLPYLPALFIWQATTLIAALAAFWAILPNRLALLVALGFPAILVCWGHGQTGFLTATLLTGGVLALRQREIAAGILFGLLAYKPQFGLLIPFVLLAGGYWRAVAAATLTVLATVAVTVALWGWPVWQAFLDSLTLTRTVVFEPGNTGFEKFQSAFAWVRLWGGSAAGAYGLQALVTGSVLVGCVAIWRSNLDHRLKGAALLVGTLLSSPYVLDYDLLVLGMAIALLAAHGLDHGFHRWEKTLLAVGWFIPACARSIAGALYLPVGFLTLVAFFVMIVLRARSEQAEAAGPAAPRAGAITILDRSISA